MSCYNFCIVSPGLVSPEGHHLQYASDIYKALQAQGALSRIYACTGYSSRGGPDYITPCIYYPRPKALKRILIKYFQRAEKDARRDSVKINTSSFSIFKYILRSFRKIWQLFVFFVTAFSIVRLLLKQSEPVHVLIEDCGLRELVPLSFVLKRAGKSVIAFHCIVRSASCDMVANYESCDSFLKRLKDLISDHAGKVFFYTDTQRLTRHYREATGYVDQFETLPIPFPSKADKVARRQGLAVPCVGMIGSPRLEKGFAHAGYLADVVASAEIRDLKLSVQIDACASDVSVAHISRELCRMASSAEGHLVVHGAESYAQYAARYASFDIVLLLYDAKRYASASSGIFVEAVRFGVPVLTFEGTWPAQLVGEAGQMGLKIGMCIKAIEEAPDALRQMLQNLDVFKQGMAEYRNYWAQHNTWDGLVSILLKNAERATARQV